MQHVADGVFDRMVISFWHRPIELDSCRKIMALKREVIVLFLVFIVNFVELLLNEKNMELLSCFGVAFSAHS